MAKYNGLFTCKEDIANEFGLTDHYINSIIIIYCYYDMCGYEGDAFVVFMENGELFEVNGGHCSCYGLEGQWKPTTTSFEYLLNGTVIPDDCKELIKFMIN
jgi:hypothetical protein